MAESAGRRLGIGIVGIGWVAGEHIKAYKNNPHCRVVALCSHDRENAARAAQLHDLPEARIYTDYEAMLRDPDVDVVSICSMNHLHVPQSIAAAEAGKHMLVEKPMAIDLDGLRKQRDAIQKSGVKCQVGFELYWGPFFQSIHQMIDAGFFGKLHYAECDYFSGNWEKWYVGYPWVKTKEKGGSALPAAGCHAVDAIRQFVRADATEVFAYSHNATGVMEWDPTILVAIQFANGVIGKVGCVLEGNLKYTFNVRLHGDKGMLINDRFLTHYLPGQTAAAQFPTILPDTPEVTHHPFQGEIDDLLDAILKDREPVVNLENGVKTHELCFAAEESACTGRPVKLPLL